MTSPNFATGTGGQSSFGGSVVKSPDPIPRSKLLHSFAQGEPQTSRLLSDNGSQRASSFKFGKRNNTLEETSRRRASKVLV